MANWREVYSLRMFREKAQVKLFCTATFRVAASCLQDCYLVPNPHRKSSMGSSRDYQPTNGQNRRYQLQSLWLYEATEGVREENEVRVGGIAVELMVMSEVTDKKGRMVRNKDTGRSYGLESIETG